MLINLQTLAAFTATSYSFESHTASTVWNLMDLNTGEISLLYNGSEVSEMIWIGPRDTSVLYVNSTNSEVEGGVELWVSDTSSFDRGYASFARLGARSDADTDTDTEQVYGGLDSSASLWLEGRSDSKWSH